MNVTFVQSRIKMLPLEYGALLDRAFTYGEPVPPSEHLPLLPYAALVAASALTETQHVSHFDRYIQQIVQFYECERAVNLLPERYASFLSDALLFAGDEAEEYKAGCAGRTKVVLRSLSSHDQSVIDCLHDAYLAILGEDWPKAIGYATALDTYFTAVNALSCVLLP